MDVACSTLCFSKKSLDKALRSIAEMEFSKVDLTVAKGSSHLTPQEVVEDSGAALQKIRQGPTIGFAALSALMQPNGEEYTEQVSAIAHLAKQLAAPILVVEASPFGTPLEQEIERLRKLERVASLQGITLTVSTKIGTLTQSPRVAVELCEAVEGLGLTLDPSYFVCGPHQGKPFDEVFPYVRHTHLRDTGRHIDQLQVKVGRGEIEYGRIGTLLSRYEYRGSLTVAIEDARQAQDMDINREVRKLRLLLESLI